jgi:hypothetical protein
MRALPEHDPRASYKAQEKRAARVVGGRQTAGSGNSKRVSHKGDAVGDLVRAEAKTTCKASLSIKRAWLEKIRREARETDKVPALMFGFDLPTPGLCTENPRDYLGGRCEDWMAFPASVAEALLKIADAVQHGDHGRAREWLWKVRGS